jgi:hypothetical protein
MASAEGLFYKALAFVYYALGAYVGLITALVSAYLVLLADAYHLALDVIKHPGSYVPWPKEPIKRLPKKSVTKPAVPSVPTSVLKAPSAPNGVATTAVPRPQPTVVRS